MNEQKSVYKNSSITIPSILVLLSLFLIGFCIYLTSHYFSTIYPTGISTGGVCNINSFFNCDVATYSPFSNIFGVPISIIGLLFSLLILSGTLFYSPEFESTIYKLLILNAIGCLLLFLYSLFFLGGLCPVCTFYYIFSWGTLFLFYKYSSLGEHSNKTLIIFSLLVLITSVATKYYVTTIEKDRSSLAVDLIKQYDGLPNLGQPSFQSEYRMASASKNFTDAKIQITKFSDFECPACKMLSSILHKIALKYKGKINIQYVYYPLQVDCNESMKSPLHTHACQAAYLTSCIPEKFSELEQVIFSNQSKLSKDYLDQLAKKYGVYDCMISPKTKEKVLKYVRAAGPFNIKSTPTFLLNGVKIEGVLPENQISILIDHLLKK